MRKTMNKIIISTIIAFLLGLIGTYELTKLSIPSYGELATASPVYIVPQGGTGASSFNKYPIVGAGGTGALTASSTLWIAGINGTSTSADSTFTRLSVTNSTTTNATSTNLFTTLLNVITASSTTFLTVNGTSTNFFSTTASSTNLFSSLLNVGVIGPSSGLIVNSNGHVGIGTTTPGTLFSVGFTGIGTNGINFTNATTTFDAGGGINIKNGCYAMNGTCISSGGAASQVTVYSTTSVQNLATTTISGIAAADTLTITFQASSSLPSLSLGAWMVFNGSMGTNAYYTGSTESGSTINVDQGQSVKLHNNSAVSYIATINFTNKSTSFKTGTYEMTSYDINNNVAQVYQGGFVWKNNAVVTSISFSSLGAGTYATTTYIQVIAK